MTGAAAPILEVRNLNKRYGATPALRDVTFSARRGEFIVVLGRSGAGKSTLMRCVNRLVEPSGGEIRFEGTPVPIARRALRRMRRRIGMIFQQFNLVKRLSVLTNVMTGTLGYKALLPSLVYHFGREEKLAALECLERVNMAHKAFQRADTLSGGEQQRVAIARVLNQKPALLLADEPVASLDPTIARTVLRDLRRINEDLGITVLLNIHQVNYAREFGERVIGLAGGIVVFDGHVRELTDDVLHRIYGEAVDDRDDAHEHA
ncbi:MAG: phosphonate ABC transporter ATP-binding protein [Rhodospirillales bacterium]|nr:phosphonate ABC transporter ATP-binding protein [Rhodospirillales bacterium]